MKILIIGASARAAAQSVRLANHDAAALDLFVDRDLSQIAECETIERYPDSILQQASRWPQHAILLAGGMENFPEIVGELEKGHLLIGPSALQIKALRDVQRWQAWAAGNEDWLRFPETEIDSAKRIAEIESGGNTDGDWLWKPHRSAGGTGVKRSKFAQGLDPDAGYFQRFQCGPVLGVTFLCLPGNSTIVGATRNLSFSESDIETSAASDFSPFMYTGSVGPISVGSHLEIRLSHWIDEIASSLGYRGLLQADFIVGHDGWLYLLEFNPRWSAGMELVEICCRRNFVEEQLRAQFPMRSSRATSPAIPSKARRIGIKKIVYAQQPHTISQHTSDTMMLQSRWQSLNQASLSPLAGWSDIPKAGTVVERGAPIATAWAIRTIAHRASCEQCEPENGQASLAMDRWPELANLIERLPEH